VSNPEKLVDVGVASERFFQFYYAHCTAPDRDTLFSLLDAAHSLNDRLIKGAGLNFFDFQEFTALKCLRNYFHHHEELREVIILVPMGKYPIDTDMLFLCLVPKKTVEAAIEETKAAYRNETRQACQGLFHRYDQVLNINPCLFNFVVRAYERLKKGDIPMSGDAVEQFEESYNDEEEKGSSHFVDGTISTLTGNVSELLADVMANYEGNQKPD
jgi:hypothetical protein